MKKHNWIRGAAAAAGLFLLDSIVLEQYFFKIKQFDIGKKNIHNKKCRMILITDLHLRNGLKPKYKRLLNKIHRLKPDIILMAGDAMDEGGKVSSLDRFLSELPAITPKAAILGNHEYKNKATIAEIKEVYEKHHIDLLINQSRAYTMGGKKLMVTGLNDFIEGDENFRKAVEAVACEEMHVALIHSPLQQEELKRQIGEINRERAGDQKLNIEYIFAGHNHGGQVTFFGLFPLLLPNKSGSYVYGWYNDSKPFLYVSKGFGNSTLPFRFGARAEIILFNYYYN